MARAGKQRFGADSPPTAVNHGGVGCARRTGQSRPGGRAARGSASGGEGDDGRALGSGSNHVGEEDPGAARSRELSDFRCEHVRSFASRRSAAATGQPGIFEVRPATRADRVSRRARRRHHQARRAGGAGGPGAAPSPAGTGAGPHRRARRGVNFADTLARVGLYPDAPKTPCVVGYEVAGEIAAVGEGVDAGRVGERVMAGTAFGGYAEQVVVPVGTSWHCPSGCPSRRAPRCRSSTRQPGRRCTATARCARASACSSTAPPAAWGSPCCSWPSAVARRSTGPPRPPSTTPARARPRPRDRLPQRRLVARPAHLRHGRRRHRRRVVQALLRAAAARRAPRRARRLLGPGGREAQPAPRAAAGAAHDARLRPHQAAERVEGRRRHQHEAPVGRPRHARAVDRAAARVPRRRTIAPVVHAAVPFARAGEAHRILAARETWGRWSLVP